MSREDCHPTAWWSISVIRGAVLEGRKGGVSKSQMKFTKTLLSTPLAKGPVRQSIYRSTWSILLQNLSLRKWPVKQNSDNLGTPRWLRRESSLLSPGMCCSQSYLWTFRSVSSRAADIGALSSSWGRKNLSLLPSFLASFFPSFLFSYFQGVIKRK